MNIHIFLLRSHILYETNILVVLFLSVLKMLKVFLESIYFPLH